MLCYAVYATYAMCAMCAMCAASRRDTARLHAPKRVAARAANVGFFPPVVALPGLSGVGFLLLRLGGEGDFAVADDGGG